MEDKNTNIQEQAETSFKPKTDIENASEKKARKAELIASAIGDAVSSLSNLFFASKGAPYIKGGTSASQNESNNTLTQAILGRHKKEDEDYNQRLKSWEKKQEKIIKEQEKEANVSIGDGVSFKKSNWESKDFINEAFDYFMVNNKDTELATQLWDRQNVHEPNLTWDGKQWEVKGHKYRDAFEGKHGTYFKRDLLEAILTKGDDALKTDDENLSNIKKLLKEFDNTWKPLK